MGYSVDILNSIRLGGSQDYQNRIPEATRQNIATIGNALQTYTELFNEFSTALLCKIGKTLLETKLFENRLARFKTGTVLNQQDVEEIFVEMAKSEGKYDSDGPNPLGRRETVQDHVVYHRMNRQDVYAITIGDIDFVRVFRSEETLDAYISAKINAVYSGANRDEFLCMVELLGTYDGYCDYNVGDPESGGTGNRDTWCKDFLKVVRKAVLDLTLEPSKNYNKAGVETWSEKKDLVLFVNKDVLVEVDVEVLAKTFNMGKTNIEVEIVAMPHFGSATAPTVALLVDRNWFRVYDTLSHMEPQRNAHGLFTNYFYHVHQIISCSPFKNAVRFTFA